LLNGVMSTMNVSRLTIIYKVLYPKYRCLIIAVNTYGGHWLRPQWYIF